VGKQRGYAGSGGHFIWCFCGRISSNNDEAAAANNQLGGSCFVQLEMKETS